MEKRVALVTGSSRGIGFAIATRLMVEDYFVIFNGVTSPSLPEDKQEIVEKLHKDSGNGSFGYVQADISTEEGRKALVDFIEAEAGRIDVLVNNAAMAPRERKDILDVEVEDYREVTRVNLEGPFFLTQAIARLMLKCKESGSFPAFNPCIINISSVSAYAASVNRAAYCISKAGISMNTTLFATRLAGAIPVHEIRPGIIETDMTKPVLEKYQAMIDDGLLPVKRIGQPEDVAEAVVAIVKNHFPYSTGNVFDVDGGFHLRRL